MADKHYIAIDLKSFYSSVECVERGLDPLDTCLVVADRTRTDKTICLAVSPPLKKLGVGGRPRLFEVVSRIRKVNCSRRCIGKSHSEKEYSANPGLAIDFIIAQPHMAKYIAYSARIYDIYLKYVAPEDIHVYSIDEVFMDVTPYLYAYRMTPHELALTIIRDVFRTTGITATAGIGTNLYLSKVAMDIVAKKALPDKDGVRIAELDEMSYRRLLWSHKPLTDFWRVGHGIADKLSRLNILTMGELARYSIMNEGVLYKLFGVNAELLIDHAWGWEPVTISDIKNYCPESHSLSSGQVLTEAYPYWKASVVVREMADTLSLELVEKKLLTSQLVLYIGYDVDNLKDSTTALNYKGNISIDHYGRLVPSHSHATINLDFPTSSSVILSSAIDKLFSETVNRSLLVRRLNITAANTIPETSGNTYPHGFQLNLFSDYEELDSNEKIQSAQREKERRQQQAILLIKRKYGKNAILKGLNYEDGATQRIRNCQIGGHRE